MPGAKERIRREGRDKDHELLRNLGKCDVLNISKNDLDSCITSTRTLLQNLEYRRRVLSVNNLKLLDNNLNDAVTEATLHQVADTLPSHHLIQIAQQVLEIDLAVLATALYPTGHPVCSAIRDGIAVWMARDEEHNTPSRLQALLKEAHEAELVDDLPVTEEDASNKWHVLSRCCIPSKWVLFATKYLGISALFELVDEQSFLQSLAVAILTVWNNGASEKCNKALAKLLHKACGLHLVAESTVAILDPRGCQAETLSTWNYMKLGTSDQAQSIDYEDISTNSTVSNAMETETVQDDLDEAADNHDKQKDKIEKSRASRLDSGIGDGHEDLTPTVEKEFDALFPEEETPPCKDEHVLHPLPSSSEAEEHIVFTNAARMITYLNVENNQCKPNIAIPDWADTQTMMCALSRRGLLIAGAANHQHAHKTSLLDMAKQKEVPLVDLPCGVKAGGMLAVQDASQQDVIYIAGGNLYRDGRWFGSTSVYKLTLGKDTKWLHVGSLQNQVNWPVMTASDQLLFVLGGHHKESQKLCHLQALNQETHQSSVGTPMPVACSSVADGAVIIDDVLFVFTTDTLMTKTAGKPWQTTKHKIDAIEITPHIYQSNLILFVEHSDGSKTVKVQPPKHAPLSQLQEIHKDEAKDHVSFYIV